MDYLLLPPGLSWIGLLLVILIFSFKLLKRWTVANPKTPPKAAGAWPMIGHLPLLGGLKLPHRILGAMADKYGPIFTIRLGQHDALVVSDREMARECFSVNDVTVSSRPSLVGPKHMGYNYAMFGFAPYGPDWREMRKLTTLELLSNRRLDLLKHIRISEVEKSVKNLYRFWADKRDSNEQVLVELNRWFGDMTLNVILRMLVGEHHSSIDDYDEKARKCQAALKDFFRLLGAFVVGDAIPWLGWLDLGGHEKAMKRTAKQLDDIVGGWLEEHKEKRDLGESKGGEDFMYVMLSLLDGVSLGGFDNDTIIKATTLAMIAGGNETTSATLTWVLSLLLNSPRSLKLAQEEIDLHVGKERRVNDLDMSKLVYLQAIVKETLRLYPTTPLSGPREFTDNCIIGGYYVAKGTRLITNVSKIQIDPKIWSDPLEFKPERFLTTHKDVDVRGNHYELIPFGSGRRACPGISMALQMVQFALASLLQAFEIKNPSNEPIDLTESSGLSNVKATAIEVLVEPRLSPNLLQ